MWFVYSFELFCVQKHSLQISENSNTFPSKHVYLNNLNITNFLPVYLLEKNFLHVDLKNKKCSANVLNNIYSNIWLFCTPHLHIICWFLSLWASRWILTENCILCHMFVTFTKNTQQNTPFIISHLCGSQTVIKSFLFCWTETMKAMKFFLWQQECLLFVVWVMLENKYNSPVCVCVCLASVSTFTCRRQYNTLNHIGRGVK